MSFDSSNDNGERHAPAGTDAHGKAAMLLVESLIHGLIARQVITVANAVEIVEVAGDVASDVDDAPATHMRPPALLDAISDSLRRDLVD